MRGVRAVITRPRWVGTWVLLAVLAIGALVTVAVMVWATGFGAQLPANAAEVGLAAAMMVGTLAFMAWALAPFAAMAAVVMAADRRASLGRAALAVVALGVVAVVALGGWALSDFVTSESSTAALIFIFLPFYQLVVVAACAVVALGVHLLARRLRPRAGGSR